MPFDADRLGWVVEIFEKVPGAFAVTEAQQAALVDAVPTQENFTSILGDPESDDVEITIKPFKLDPELPYDDVDRNLQWMQETDP